MDFAHPSQIKLLIKHLGPNFSEFNYIDDKGKFSYIKEEKKLVKFVNSNYIVIEIKNSLFNI